MTNRDDRHKDHGSRPSHDAVHLLALAAAMEQEGQYNIAKALRAGCDAILTKSAYSMNMPSDRPSLIEELTWGIDVFERNEESRGLSRALQEGKQALIEDRLPLVENIPDPFVCRICGQAYLDTPSAPCPTCGAAPDTFQHVPAVYYLNEFEPMIALEKLIDAPTRLSSYLSGLDEEFLAKQPGEDRWSIRQFMTHIRDAEGVLNGRVKQFAIEQDPVLTSQAVWEWATSDEAGESSTSNILENFRISRAETVDELKRFAVKDWWREGRHEEFGTVTLKQQASYFAAHELTHISQIRFLVSS